MRTAAFVDDAGRRVAEIPSDLFMGRGVDDVEIMRGDLARILVAATDAVGGVEYLYGDTVTGLAEGPDGVEVTFEHDRRARSTWSWGPTGCTPGCGRCRSGPRSSSCTTSGTASRSTACPTISAWTGRSCCTRRSGAP